MWSRAMRPPRAREATGRRRSWMGRWIRSLKAYLPCYTPLVARAHFRTRCQCHFVPRRRPRVASVRVRRLVFGQARVPRRTLTGNGRTPYAGVAGPMSYWEATDLEKHIAAVLQEQEVAAGIPATGHPPELIQQLVNRDAVKEATGTAIASFETAEEAYERGKAEAATAGRRRMSAF